MVHAESWQRYFAIVGLTACITLWDGRKLK
jgi:hypothetical protein